MSGTQEQPGDFLAEVFRFLDGELSDEEARRLQQRIEGDAELQARFDAIAEVDAMQRVTRAFAPPAEDAGGGRGRTWGLGWLALLAATALAMLALWSALTARGRDEQLVELRMSALAVDASLESYNERLGLPGDWLPPGHGLLGAPAEQPAPTVEEYAQRALALERERVTAALLSGGSQPVSAARFTVPFRADRDSYAVCILVPEDDEAALLEPAPGDPPRRFEGGRAQVLPRPTVALAPERALFDWGYRLSPTTAQAVVVLGLRTPAVDAETLAELRALLDSLGPRARLEERVEHLRSWLEQHGFAAQGVRLAGED